MTEAQYTQVEIVAVLAPTLGEERASELVRVAMASYDLSSPLTSRDAIRVLELIGRASGFVGSVARFALARFTLRDAANPGTRHRDSSSMRAVHEVSFARRELTDLLAPTLGQEKSEEIVVEAMAALGLPRENVTITQALDLLDHMANAESLVGVAARFARARLLMRARKPG